MKRFVLLLFVLILAIGLAGCGGEDAAVDTVSGGETGTGGELVLGENAFGVSFTVKKVSDEPVVFIVEPFADKFGQGSNEIEFGEGLGIWGTDALVAGTKKGKEADLQGSFTIYADSKDGPSVTIDVEGTYKIDEEGFCETEDHMFYYLYQDGQFTVSDRVTVMGF